MFVDYLNTPLEKNLTPPYEKKYTNPHKISLTDLKTEEKKNKKKDLFGVFKGFLTVLNMVSVLFSSSSLRPYNVKK